MSIWDLSQYLLGTYISWPLEDLLGNYLMLCCEWTHISLSRWLYTLWVSHEVAILLHIWSILSSTNKMLIAYDTYLRLSWNNNFHSGTPLTSLLHAGKHTSINSMRWILHPQWIHICCLLVEIWKWFSIKRYPWNINVNSNIRVFSRPRHKCSFCSICNSCLAIISN